MVAYGGRRTWGGGEGGAGGAPEGCGSPGRPIANSQTFGSEENIYYATRGSRTAQNSLGEPPGARVSQATHAGC